MKKLLLLLILFSGSLLQAQNVNISDTNFKNALLNHIPVIDTNGDGEIQISEATAFTGTIDVSHQNIWDLTGIEAFTNITGLNCEYNRLQSINVSNNVALTELYCGYNQINHILDVTQNANLTKLNCYGNIITNLDVSQNTNLTELNCGWNVLDNLDVTNNPDLTILKCSHNQLTNLDISQNMDLTELHCENNSLQALDVTQNANLLVLKCNNNHLGTLDISNNTDLNILNCSNDYLSSLDLSNNTNLTELYCKWNFYSNLNLTNNVNLSILDCSQNMELSNLILPQNANFTEIYCEYSLLSNIDVSNQTNLRILHCDHNQLNSLNTSNDTNLIEIHCEQNQLTNLNISNNTNLTHLYCESNQLTSFDVSQSPNLIKLWCYRNQLTSLDVTQNTSLINFKCGGNQLTSLDVTNNTNLELLSCGNNQLNSLDVTNNTNLTSLYCDNNQISSLDVSNNTDLTTFDCYNNQLDDIDVSGNTNLTSFYCGENQFSSLDVSNNAELVYFSIHDDSNLTYINLKNGNNDNLALAAGVSYYENLPNLQTVCVDEVDTNLTSFIISEAGHPVTFTKYCSFSPAQSNTISGKLLADINSNGCDVNDLPMSNILVTTDNGTESFGTFTQDSGDYLLYTNEGNFSTTVVATNLPNYFSINPNAQTNTFTGYNNTFTADFCIEPTQTVNDVNISLIPTGHARQGLYTTYILVYRNVGTTQLNGDITLDFNSSKLHFENAGGIPHSQNGNRLTFYYSNLNPFETREIGIVFHVYSPPAVQTGDVLSFTANINPVAGDATPNDNTVTLNQTVVGSYDPNDITCLEGDEILPADTDKYLHYVIRFQNTGTAEAQNIVVANELDDNLDWSTLQLESISHNNRVAITNGKDVEFIFENINLPDSTTDEPNSHGYIAYKIKPKASIALGDVISNNADIYFDYNPAVATNTVTTTVVNSLGIDKNTLLDFSVYPTPTTNILNVSSKTKIEQISIYNQLGQSIIETQKTPIDVSNLSKGVYLVKVKDINGNFGITKVVKR